jgi:hypothetical protein
MLRSIARIFVVLGSVAIVIGFFLPVFAFFPASLWDATGSPDFWKVWSLLILAGLSLLALVGATRLTGIVHLVLSCIFLVLLYFSLSSHTIGSHFGSFQMPVLDTLFASWSSFFSFIDLFGVGGNLVFLGALGVLLGGLLETLVPGV